MQTEQEIVELDGKTYLVIDTDPESKGNYKFQAVELFSPQDNNMDALIDAYYEEKYKG